MTVPNHNRAAHADYEHGTSDNGTSWTRFSIAVSGRKKDDVSFFKAACFGKTAEALAPYLLKGKQVCIAGSLSQTKYKTREGESRAETVIQAGQIQLLGGGNKDGGGYPKEWE